jgi:hypothetical protein
MILDVQRCIDGRFDRVEVELHATAKDVNDTNATAADGENAFSTRQSDVRKLRAQAGLNWLTNRLFEPDTAAAAADAAAADTADADVDITGDDTNDNGCGAALAELQGWGHHLGFQVSYDHEDARF